MKLRIIYAVADPITVLGQYVTHGFELNCPKHLEMWLAPSQKPHDVLAWNFESLQHASLSPETCIYSLDYSDFNKEHSSIELAMISFAFA